METPVLDIELNKHCEERFFEYYISILVMREIDLEQEVFNENKGVMIMIEFHNSLPSQY